LLQVLLNTSLYLAVEPSLQHQLQEFKQTPGILALLAANRATTQAAAAQDRPGVGGMQVRAIAQEHRAPAHIAGGAWCAVY